jgi:flavin-dependent dehydrogenase
METRIVIIGGVAGGMSAATRARRMNEQASIVVLEKTGHISFANCGLPYFISGAIKDECALFLTTPEQVAKRYRIDARVHHEVTSILREQHRKTRRGRWCGLHWAGDGRGAALAWVASDSHRKSAACIATARRGNERVG